MLQYLLNTVTKKIINQITLVLKSDFPGKKPSHFLNCIGNIPDNTGFLKWYGIEAFIFFSRVEAFIFLKDQLDYS